MREHWVTMGALQLLVIALAAMMAIGTTDATAFQLEEPVAKIPTSCPAIDPMDSTVHLRHEVMCSLFYKCHAGDKIVQLCALENAKTGNLLHFNPELQVCDWRRNVSCTYPPCSLNTDKNGRPIKLPYGGDCRHYYDCLNNQLVIRECPQGENFDYNLRLCRRKSDANCGPIQECDSIYKERVEENCSFYSICLATRKVILPCPAGKYFSQSRQDCVDKRDSDCNDGPEPIPCKGTGKSPHPTDCNLYTECVNGFVETKSCGKGLHFNPFSHECQSPSEAGCDSSRPCFAVFPFHLGPVRCNGDHKAPNKCDCRDFKVCMNGIVKDVRCENGFHFNPHAEECQHPCDAKCDKKWPCPTPTPTPKPPECTGDRKIPDEHDCNKYKQCVNGKIVSMKCPDGQHFNPFQEKCMHPCDAGCDKNWPCPTPTPTPKPPECTGDRKVPDEHDCNKYKQCVNGKIESKKCPNGEHFNPYQEKCMHPCDAGCDKNWPCPTPTPTPKPPECTGDRKIPDEHDCTKYKQCVNGKIESKKCPNGEHFNPYQEKCMHPCDAGCDKNWPCPTPTPTPKPPECTGDRKVPDEHDCNKYKQCVNGKIESKKCPNGEHFNPYQEKCMHPCDAGCDKNWPCPTPTPTPKPPECTGDRKVPDEHDCNKYKQCVNGRIESKKCPNGEHFNPYQEKCMHPCDAGCDKNWPCPTPTPTPKPPECTGDRKIPDEHDCNKYKQCVNGKIESKQCPSGLHFNPYKQTCEHPCDAGCDKNWPCPTPTPTPKPPACSGDRKVPNRCDCSSYMQCVNGVIKTIPCPDGLHFNPFEQKCEHPCDAGCDPHWPCGTPGPPQCSGNGMSPDPNDCRVYTICVDGILKSKICPDGNHFNPFAHECQDPSIAGCDDSNCGGTPTPPPTECNGHVKSPDKCDCKSYRQCEKDKIVTKKCPPGLDFNPFELECQDPCDARCDKHRVCPTPSNPPPAECSGNYRIGDLFVCSIYRECVNGKIKTRTCPFGTHFNPFAQECQHPCDAHCDLTWPCPTPTPEPEPECSGNSKSPDPDNCRIYLECKNGMIKEHLCPNGMHFNPYAQQCQPPDQAGCDDRDTCTPVCTDGDRIPHFCDCKLYYECVNGDYKIRSCGKKFHFNPNSKKCEPADGADCVLPLPSFGNECDGSHKVPHEFNCSSYYKCKNNVKIPKDCPFGQEFSTFAQACVDPKDSRTDCEAPL